MPPCTDLLPNLKLKIFDEKLISELNFNIFDPHSHDQRHVAEFKIMPTACVRHFRFFKFYPKLLTHIRIMVIAFFTCTNGMVYINVKEYMLPVCG